MNLEFLELNKNKPISGEGLKRRRKKVKATTKGNASLTQLLENMKIKKEKEKDKDEREMLRKQKEYYKLFGI